MPHSQPTELRARPRGQTYHRQTRLIQLDKHPSLSPPHRPSPGGCPPTRSPLHSCTLARGRHQAGPRSQHGTTMSERLSSALAQTCRSSTDQVQGGLPADSESTAQLHPGPLPLLHRAKMTTWHHQATTTPLDTRPNLPLLYGPSFGTSPPTRSPVPDCTGTCGRHHGHPPRTPNGQQLKPTCAADLPTCRSSTDQVTASPPQIGNHPTGSVTSPACRSRRTRPPTASSTDPEE